MSLFTFGPIYQERIWGGATLQTLLGREIPQGKPIGESWELVDRPEAVSPVVGEGKTLHDLWTTQRAAIFGKLAPNVERFPILIKILDCRETLSVQVHPPAALAAQLKGEPKTEMWYFLRTEPNAKIYAGLKRGVTADDFRQAVGTPKLAGLLHEVPTQPGEAMFLPSGRVHAIGAGNLILEIQQNSDTTYRVDDWGRVDSEGKPRQLHIEQAQQSIRFDDYEPVFAQPHGEKVVECVYFLVRRVFLYPGEFRSFNPAGQTFHYHFVADGAAKQGEREFKTGDGWLVPANHSPYDVEPVGEGAELVTVSFPG